MQLNYIVLGQRIQKIRKSKHISQAVLSAMIDKSAGYISYLECGTKVMSLETFVSIANALEVSTDTLLSRQLTSVTEMSNIEAQRIFANCSPYAAGCAESSQRSSSLASTASPQGRVVIILPTEYQIATDHRLRD